MKGFSQRFSMFKSQASAFLDRSTHRGGGAAASNNDETASEVSDMSYATVESRATFTLGSMMSPFKGSVLDEEVDIAMRNLYDDPDVLERRCELSALGKSFSEENAAEEFATLKDTVPAEHTKSSENVIEDLPGDYFTEGYDPIVTRIEEVEQWEDAEMVENFMEHLEDADQSKDFIMTRLADKIQENFDDLMTIVRDGKDIDTDLSAITFQLMLSRRNIADATKVLAEGGMKINRLNRRKEKLYLVQESIQSLKAIKDLHRAMRQYTVTGDLGRAAECACTVLQYLQSPSIRGYAKDSSESKTALFEENTPRKDEVDIESEAAPSPCMFHALQQVATDTQSNLQNIRYKADKALSRICTRKFAAAEYANIMQSYLVLDYLHETTGLVTREAKSKEEGELESYGDNIRLREDGEIEREQNEAPPDEAGDNTETCPIEGEKGTPAAAAQSIPAYTSCIDNLATRIQKYLLEDIDACLNNAALEFIFASQHKKQQAAMALCIEGMSSSITGGDMFDLAELELDELYNRASPDLVAPIVVRTCELLADIVHTHFMISQWHAAPFDPRNEDTQFLHRSVPGNLYSEEDSGMTSKETSISEESRSKIDMSFGDGDEGDISAAIAEALRIDESQAQSPPPSAEKLSWKHTLNASDSPSQLLQKMGALQLSFALQKIRGSRPTIWVEIEAAVVRMLNGVNVTASVNADDVLAITWAVNAIIGMGREFGNSRCKSIVTAMHMFHRDYFERIHHENFNVLRQMIESEPWRSIPVNLASVGGIMGVIRSHIAKRSECAWGLREMVGLSLGLSFNYLTDDTQPVGSTADSPMDTPCVTPGTPCEHTPGKMSASTRKSKQDSILKVFAAHGNPLHFMTGGHAGDAVEGDVNDDDNKESRIQASAAKTNNDLDSNAKSFLAMLLDDEDVSRSTKKAQDLTSSLVVTQTSLNGLARYAGKYMQIMYLMPSAASDILNALFRLFDFYLCSVFVGFVPVETRRSVLSKPRKATMPPPDQSKDFEALQQYMDRTLNEFVQLDVPPPLRKTFLVDMLSAEVSSNAGPGNATSATGSHSGIPASVSGSDLPSEATLSPRSETQSIASAPSSTKKDFMHSMSRGLKHFNGSVTHASSTAPSSLSQGRLAKVSSLLRVPTVVEENDPMSFCALHERIAAAESCWFVSTILAEIKTKVLKLLPEDCMQACEDYIRHFHFISGQLRGLIYRSVCPILIKSNIILSQILDSSAGFDSRKARQAPHEWVDKLSAYCNEVWVFMQQGDSFSDASSALREQLWLEVCQAAFDLLLEGFSRLRKCSPEGRQLMELDVASLQHNLDSIHPCRPPRGKQYLDAWVAATGMAEGEMLDWVRENFESYAYRHINGLLVQTLSSVMHTKPLKEATHLIDRLYDVHQEKAEQSEQLTKLSKIFSYHR